MVLWIVPTVVVALIAVGGGILVHKRKTPKSATTAPFTSNRNKNDINSSTIYVIGDLHGDAQCALHWIQKIGVVDDIKNPTRWMDPQTSVVFMGDYCDKGPQSKQVMEIVMTLTDTFPTKVTALMGNHEMELLKDRDVQRPYFYYHMPYAVVHPGEYLNYLQREQDKDDDIVFQLLMQASLEVYGNNWYKAVRYAPSVVRGHSVVELMQPEYQPLVKERLAEYQQAYINAYRSNTTLGKWLMARPVIHLQDGVLFTHGGVSAAVMEFVDTAEKVNEMNAAVLQNAGEEDFLTFMESTPMGIAAEKLMLFRGNHGNCDLTTQLLDRMEYSTTTSTTKLVVGHTPDESVRVECNGRFLAADSLLGRYIRTSGNQYCTDQGGTSTNGRFVCPPVEQTCQGQIVKITNGNTVELIEA
jgi:predicted MPP superfamily phosphohydrolase